MPPTRRGDPLVSVVIPTYGRDVGFLREAVDSALEQTHSNLELLVVDDAPDPIRDEVESLDERVRVLRGNDEGVSAARNLGIRAAGGEFVAFLDDDDRWEPGKTARQLAAFREGGPDVGVVYTGQRYVNDDGDVIGTYVPDVEGRVTTDLLFGRINCAFSSLMVRAAAVETAQLLDERFDNWEDWEWCVRLSVDHEFRCVSAPLVRRRDGDHEQLTDDFEAMRDRTYPLFLRKHRPLAASYGAAAERRMVAALSLSLGGEALDNGHYGDARRYLLRSIRTYPFSRKAHLYFALALGGRLTYEPAKFLKERTAALLEG